jgi:hypothetical protein
VTPLSSSGSKRRESESPGNNSPAPKRVHPDLPPPHAKQAASASASSEPKAHQKTFHVPQQQQQQQQACGPRTLQPESANIPKSADVPQTEAGKDSEAQAPQQHDDADPVVNQDSERARDECAKDAGVKPGGGKAVTEEYELTVMSIEVLCSGPRPGKLVPDPEHDGILAVCYAVSESGRRDRKPLSKGLLVLLNKDWYEGKGVDKSVEWVLGLPKECEVATFQTEAQVFEAFEMLVIERDPDMLVGFEVCTYMHV